MDFYVVRWNDEMNGSTIRSEFFNADEAIKCSTELISNGKLNVTINKEPYPFHRRRMYTR